MTEYQWNPSFYEWYGDVRWDLHRKCNLEDLVYEGQGSILVCFKPRNRRIPRDCTQIMIRNKSNHFLQMSTKFRTLLI